MIASVTDSTTEVCDCCDGTGIEVGRNCSHCGGSGYIQIPDEFFDDPDDFMLEDDEPLELEDRLDAALEEASRETGLEDPRSGDK